MSGMIKRRCSVCFIASVFFPCLLVFKQKIMSSVVGMFPHPYKCWFVLLPNQCGTPQSTPLRAQRSRWHSFLPPIDVGPPLNPPPFGASVLTAHHLVSTPIRGTTRRLTHRPVSGSDTICNNPCPPLADIVLFGLSLSGFLSRL